MPDAAFLLDTDIVSLFGRQNAPPGLRPWLLRIGIDRLAISYPTFTELMRGAHIKRKQDPEKAEQIMAWVRRILAASFPAPDMTPEVADVYAHMTAEPSLRNMWTVQREQKSNRLGHDLMLAAVSITHKLPILSANVSDFLRINDSFPLPGLYHPLEGQWRLNPVHQVSMPAIDYAERDLFTAELPSLGGFYRRTQQRENSLKFYSSAEEPIDQENRLLCQAMRIRSTQRGSIRYVGRHREVILASRIQERNK
jgi:predicted nucleic acid-binding protein